MQRRSLRLTDGTRGDELALVHSNHVHLAFTVSCRVWLPVKRNLPVKVTADIARLGGGVDVLRKGCQQDRASAGSPLQNTYMYTGHKV